MSCSDIKIQGDSGSRTLGAKEKEGREEEKVSTADWRSGYQPVVKKVWLGGIENQGGTPPMQLQVVEPRKGGSTLL